jgi:hypothetical protein
MFFTAQHAPLASPPLSALELVLYGTTTFFAGPQLLTAALYAQAW